MTYFDEDMIPATEGRQRRELEHCLQIQVKAFSREAIDDIHKFMAFDRSKQHSRFQHEREAARGIRRGTPDTILTCLALNGRGIWCELKTPGNRPTDDQFRMGADLQACGAMWFWTDGVIGYMDGIASFGVPLRRNARLIAEHREGLFRGYLLKNIVPKSYRKPSPEKPSLDRVRRTESVRRKVMF